MYVLNKGRGGVAAWKKSGRRTKKGSQYRGRAEEKVVPGRLKQAYRGGVLTTGSILGEENGVLEGKKGEVEKKNGSWQAQTSMYDGGKLKTLYEFL